MIRYGDAFIIGVDQGNFNMKSVDTCFASAYTEISGDGGAFAHVLQYENRCYALGGDRVEQRDDKADDDFLILTLFSIAQELEKNGIPYGRHDVYLGTTLPPAYMKIISMRSNMKQFYRREFAFKYNGRSYRINIKKVYVCPQAESALYGNVLTEEMTKTLNALPADQQEAFKLTARPIDIIAKEPIAVLVDIGGGTVDPVILYYGIPQPFEYDSPAKGVIFTYNRIVGNIKSKFGSEINEVAINMLLRGENIRVSDAQADEIRCQMDRYSGQLFMQLQEKKLPFSNAYTLVQGGGVDAVRDGWSKMPEFAKLDFLTEIKATAIGCEQLVLRSLEKAESKRESKVG